MSFQEKLAKGSMWGKLGRPNEFDIIANDCPYSCHHCKGYQTN
jgi:hypothetical protein